MTLPTNFWHSISATRGSPGPFSWSIWPKISIFGHFVALNGLQSVHLDSWSTSNVGIGSHWHYKPIFDTWYQAQGGHRVLLWPIWPKIWFFCLFVALDDFNPFIWTADQLLMLGEVPADLTNQFLILDITHRGSPGCHQGYFGGRFDQKSCF